MTSYGDLASMIRSVRRASRGAGLALAAALALPLAGCSIDTALQINDPDIVRPEDLSGTAGTASLRAGALGNFALGFSGNNGGQEGVALASGLFADEYYSSDTFSTRQDVDFRGNPPDNGTQQATFRNIQAAREAARIAEAAIAALPTQDASTALQRHELKNLEGMAYVLVGEIWCSNVPFSTTEQLARGEGGVPLTTNQVMDTAIAKFNEGIALSGSADQVAFSRVATARALLNKGDFAGAVAAVAAVPTSFNYLIRHSTTSGRQENGLHQFNWLSERWSVPPGEGTNGLNWHNDPRTAVKRNAGTNLGFDNLTPQFDAAKYPLRNGSVLLISGLEARLIEAEALARANDPAYLTILNNLRATPPAYAFINRDATFAGVAGTPWSASLAAGVQLTALTDPGTQAARVTQVFNERAYWLYGTSHRMGDLRRLVRQYGRNAETVFPTGNWHKGGAYGNAVNFPVPVDEQNSVQYQEAGGLSSCDRLAA